MLRWLGPESYEAGGSRLVKGWLRRRLLIDTGEEDSQEGEEEKDTGKPERQAQGATQQRQQHAAADAAGAEGDRGGMGSRKPGRCRTAHLCPVLQGPARALQERHVSMKEFGIVNAYWDKQKEAFNAMPSGWQRIIKELQETTGKTLYAAEAAAADADSAPPIEEPPPDANG